jgi:hypothetical protein
VPCLERGKPVKWLPLKPHRGPVVRHDSRGPASDREQVVLAS